MALPTLQELMLRSAEYLTKHGLSNARRETEWIFADTLRMTRMELYTRFDMPLEDAEVARLRALITRRGKREPLAYVIGNQPFCEITLHVGPGVLVPRPETEELVELILRDPSLPPAPRILDIGTGSGAIALAIKHARPAAQVTATDVSPAALTIAQNNAQRLGLVVTFQPGHLATHVSGPFDVVVANLPYIGTDERGDCDPELAFEPQEALFSGVDGLELIRELIPDVRRLLAPQGVAWLEHGWKQAAAITQLAQVAGLVSRVVTDGSGKDRFTCLTERP